MLNVFRMVSLIEGLSYLAILSITAGIISRDYIFYLGMGHGVLFILYLVLSLQVSHQHKWSIIVWLLIFIASVIPFAFIAVDIYLKKQLHQGKTP